MKRLEGKTACSECSGEVTGLRNVAVTLGLFSLWSSQTIHPADCCLSWWPCSPSLIMLALWRGGVWWTRAVFLPGDWQEAPAAAAGAAWVVPFRLLSSFQGWALGSPNCPGWGGNPEHTEVHLHTDVAVVCRMSSANLPCWASVGCPERGHRAPSLAEESAAAVAMHAPRRSSRDFQAELVSDAV